MINLFGIVHGGVNAPIAETAASLGANEATSENQIPVGVDIHTHHLSVKSDIYRYCDADQYLPYATDLSVTVIESQHKQQTSISTVTLMNKHVSYDYLFEKLRSGLF